MIVGVGGMGREAHAWVIDAADDGAPLRPIGFLDGDPARHHTEVAGLEVLGDVDWLADHPRVGVVLGVGDPGARAGLLRTVDRLRSAPVTVVHPTAYVGRRVELGAGTVVCPRAVLTTDITVGRAVIVNFGAVVGHDGRIGDVVNVGPNAAIAGNVHIGEGADIGIGASVRQGTTIGAWSRIGAGAVVTRDVRAGVTAVGVPARPRAEGTDEEATHARMG